MIRDNYILLNEFHVKALTSAVKFVIAFAMQPHKPQNKCYSHLKKYDWHVCLKINPSLF